MLNRIATLVFLASTLIVPTVACADDFEEIQALQDANVTLVQAIQTAEAHVGGQAIEASIDDDSFSPMVEVSVVVDGRVFDVRVNAEDGTVIGAREDRDD